jgi:hypothetical protein
MRHGNAVTRGTVGVINAQIEKPPLGAFLFPLALFTARAFRFPREA